MTPLELSDFGRMLSVGAIRFEDSSALAERVGQGKVSGYTALPDSACWQLQLLVGKPWSMMVGPFVCFHAQMGVGTFLSPCRDSISGNLGSFFFGGAFSGRRALTIEHSLMSGCVQGCEPTQNVSIKP